VRRSFDVSELSFLRERERERKRARRGWCGWENRGLGCWHLGGKGRLVFG
jgi:hypothetical protein